MKCLPKTATAGKSILLASAGIAQAADVSAGGIMLRLKGVAPAEVLSNATLLNYTEAG